ncbi:hypothetical protein [Maribacter sp. 2308TA10-17]|uniref:hypothetical protein n=1 Tax=Maribacter sp. 2308TA10-17 TaxID=3386276 RepID=UPI0039BCEF40
MKISFNKPKMMALVAISLFAVSCSVKGELEDLAEELEDTTTTAKVEQSVD